MCLFGSGDFEVESIVVMLDRILAMLKFRDWIRVMLDCIWDRISDRNVVRLDRVVEFWIGCLWCLVGCL